MLIQINFVIRISFIFSRTLFALQTKLADIACARQFGRPFTPSHLDFFFPIR